MGLYSVIEARKRAAGLLALSADGLRRASRSPATSSKFRSSVLEQPGFVVVSYRTNGGGDRGAAGARADLRLPGGFRLLSAMTSATAPASRR